jgi:hypothetical protein
MRRQLKRLVVKVLPACKDVCMEAEEIIKIRYQTTAIEDIEDLVRAILSESARAI